MVPRSSVWRTQSCTLYTPYTAPSARLDQPWLYCYTVVLEHFSGINTEDTVGAKYLCRVRFLGSGIPTQSLAFVLLIIRRPIVSIPVDQLLAYPSTFRCTFRNSMSPFIPPLHPSDRTLKDPAGARCSCMSCCNHSSGEDSERCNTVVDALCSKCKSACCGRCRFNCGTCSANICALCDKCQYCDSFVCPACIPKKSCALCHISWCFVDGATCDPDQSTCSICDDLICNDCLFHVGYDSIFTHCSSEECSSNLCKRCTDIVLDSQGEQDFLCADCCSYPQLSPPTPVGSPITMPRKINFKES